MSTSTSVTVRWSNWLFLNSKDEMNYSANVTRLKKIHKSDPEGKMLSDSKCQAISCHVEELIWEILNGADQVVLCVESIGILP